MEEKDTDLQIMTIDIMRQLPGQYRVEARRLYWEWRKASKNQDQREAKRIYAKIRRLDPETRRKDNEHQREKYANRVKI